MELTIPSIIAFVTLIIGQITKKTGLVEKKYIPIQTFVIGLVSGVLCYITGLVENPASAMITCIISSMAASGLYDLGTIKKEGE